MLKSVAVSALLLFTCLSERQVAAAQDDEVQRTAADALGRFVESWNRAAAGDARGVPMYGDLYWPEADLVDPSGNVWNGQPAVVQMHVDLWAGPFNGSTVRGVVRKARRLSPTIMIADLDLALFAPRTAPPGSTAPPDTIRAHLKLIMEKRGDVWKTISSQNTFFSLPAPANRSSNSSGITDPPVPYASRYSAVLTPYPVRGPHRARPSPRV